MSLHRIGCKCLPLLFLLTATVHAAITPAPRRHSPTNSDQAKATLALDTGATTGTVVRQPSPQGLGSYQPVVNSRGHLVAQTWRDWLSNANMGRTVGSNPPGNGFGTAVQFVWPHKASPNTSDRTKWAWGAYDAGAGAYVSNIPIVQNNDPGSNEAGTYPKIVIDPASGRAIIGGQDFPNQGSFPDWTRLHVVFDATPMSGLFGDLSAGSVMPDSINQLGNIESGTNSTVWPAMGMTTSATDTALYLFAYENAVNHGAVKVYRKLGTVSANPDNSWQLVFADTSFWPTCEFAASRVSTSVAAIWTKQTVAGKAADNTYDADVWYATSSSGQSGTWTRHNLTNYSGAGYRAWIEVSGLYDSNDKLHILWNGAVTDGTSFGSRSCRLFNWSEYNPSTIYTVYNAEWNANATGCVGGSSVLNVGNFSMGECDRRLYVIYSAWNDPNQSSNVDDCAKDAPFSRGANGELYFVTSKDLQGKSWSAPQNLSDSYTKDCDSSGNCADDRYASIAEQGIDNNIQPGNWGPSGATYDACGGSPANYIQVWYLTDRYPGGGSLNPGIGPMTLNDYRWIRLACNQSCPNPPLFISPSSIGFPAFVLPGVERDTTLTLYNMGTTDLTVTSVDVQEDSCVGPGCVSGWLGVSNIPTTIPWGPSTATLRLNQNGVVGTGLSRLVGKVIFHVGPPQQAETVKVDLLVGQPAQPTYDSIKTSCSIALAVGNSGNMGNNYLGGLNMNFRPPVECDTGANSRGDASIYLGDGSPVIVRKVGTAAARASWSIFSQGYANSNGFKPLPAPNPQSAKTTTAQYEQYFSGTFTTVDSLVKIEKTWYAPKTSAADCQFIVQKMQIFPATIGTAVTNLQIGEAFDWDVPSDSGNHSNAGGSANVSGYDAGRKLVWVRGFNSADGVTDCWDNSLRYAGSALYKIAFKSATSKCMNTADSILYGGYAAANDSFVYPASGFVPEQTWNNMKAPGYAVEPRVTDVHVMLTYKGGETGWTLPANDTMTVYTIMAVTRTAANTTAGLDSLKKEIDRGKVWARAYTSTCSCCIGRRGNVNGIGTTDLADLSALVSYLTGGGYVLSCWPAADLNGNGVVDLGDLAPIVLQLTGGPVTALPCPY